jgi:hypothetical protein
MRRDNIFWGGVLILLGGLFLLQRMNVIPSVGPYLWPLALILVGGWLILSVYWRPSPSDADMFSIPLGEAKSVKYRFSHGAGQLEILGGAPMGQAIVGTSATGMNRESRMNGNRLEVKVEAGPSFVPFLGPSEGVWRFQLTQEIPVTVTVESGASSMNIDLKDVQASLIQLKTGASATNLTLPARGASLLEVEAGAASTNIRVPEATAARIRVREGVTALNVDTDRFPLLDSGLYQSPNFDSASARADINVQAGLGSISVK